MNRDIYQAITERFVEQLKRGTVPWQKPWFAVQNIVSRKPYRGINSLLLGSAELPIPVLDHFQAKPRPWRPCEEGREIHAGHLLQDPRKAGRSREGGAAGGRQASPHSLRPMGECFQSRPDRRHPGPDDHGEPEHVTTARKGGCHRGKCQALPDPPRGIRRLLLAQG